MPWGDWGPCVPDGGAQCGRGSHQRSQQCPSSSGETTGNDDIDRCTLECTTTTTEATTTATEATTTTTEATTTTPEATTTMGTGKS